MACGCMWACVCMRVLLLCMCTLIWFVEFYNLKRTPHHHSASTSKSLSTTVFHMPDPTIHIMLSVCVSLHALTLFLSPATCILWCDLQTISVRWNTHTYTQRFTRCCVKWNSISGSIREILFCFNPQISKFIQSLITKLFAFFVLPCSLVPFASPR